MANWFKLGMLLITAAVGVAISYYFLGYVPQRDAEARVQQVVSRNIVQQELQNCLADAKAQAGDIWNKNCGSQGPDCSLALNVASALNARYQSAENICLQEYPQ